MIPGATTPDAALPGSGRLRAYMELAKLSIVAMVVGTTAVGFHLGAVGSTDWTLFVHTILSTGLAAAGTMALNQYLEADLDALMLRTRHRPLPAGALRPREAFMFGLVAVVAGLVWQWATVNPLATIVTATIAVTYLGLYTPLKRVTPLCSLIGAAPGALPPVTGWAAARGDLGIEAWVLFAILFLWQLPHSLAIARLYRDDYARAGIRLLPVIDPDGPSTGHQIVLNSAGLLTVALLPTVLGVTGPLYFAAALGLGLWLLFRSIRLARTRGLAEARKLLYASIVYLPLLLGVMAFDKGDGLAERSPVVRLSGADSFVAVDDVASLPEAADPRR